LSIELVAMALHRIFLRFLSSSSSSSFVFYFKKLEIIHHQL
jgi:hypothetical protein